MKRHHCVRQYDESDCGAAAVASIALHHKVPVSVQRVRELAGTDAVGTSLLGLAHAAEALGFSATGVRATFEAFPDVPLPAVAHQKLDDGTGHFVVVYRIRRGRVVIADPASGVRTLTRDEFCRTWTGHLLLLVPDPGRPADASPRSTPPWRRLLSIVCSNRTLLVEALFCALLMTLLGISTSYFVQQLVDHVLTGGEVALLNALGIGMLLILGFRSLFSLLRELFLAYISRKVDLSLLSAYSRHLLRLPLGFFETRRVGEILSRMNDAVKVRDAVSGTALGAIVDGVLVCFVLFVLWLYDPHLAAVATLFVPALLAGLALHHPAVRKRSRQAMEESAHLTAQIAEDVTGVEAVKTYGIERYRQKEGEERLVGFAQSVFSLTKLGVRMEALGTLISSLAGVVLLWYGGHRVIEGHLTIGQLLFYYTLLGYMLGPLQRLASVHLQIEDAFVALDRLFQVLDIDTEDMNERGVGFEGVRDSIEFEQVSFRYGTRDNVLDGIDLRIPAGSTVAVVGESGSGKSTLLKLVSRLHDSTNGRIRIDGVDLRDFNLVSLRERIGIVPQDPFIFRGTIRDNIALACPGASLRDIMDAARMAGLQDFISGLPERYDTLVGERGANLSGGQRQRLAIARALLRKPDILILDEATSHLDTATERAVWHNLGDSLKDTTVIIVAHRLRTVLRADLIYVLDQGKIVERGSHRELLEEDGWYGRLWQGEEAGSTTAGDPTQGSVDDDVHSGMRRKVRNNLHHQQEYGSRLCIGN